MALPRAIPHPQEKAPEPVFLKGTYAIRRDGAVFLNNPNINARTDMQFVDELPEWHTKAAKEAKERDDRLLQARMEHAAREEDRLTLERAAVRDRIEQSRRKSLETAPSPETQDGSEHFMIANAGSVEELADFAQKTYNVRLDRRKSLNKLRLEVDAIRKNGGVAPEPEAE